jgi:hypothetical protein
MRNLMITLFFLFGVFPALAGIQREFLAVVRSDKDKAIEKEVLLTDFISDSSFDGKYFKIVLGKSEEAIPFNASQDNLLRAATVYYHLMKARDYFTSKIKSTFVLALPKLTVRLNLTNQFSELGHFANDNLDPQYNNALTVPSGEGFPRRGIAPWGTEIWFRPQKKVHLSEIDVNDFKAIEYKALTAQFRKLIHMQTFQRFLASSVLAISGGSSGEIFSVDNIIRTAGASVVMEAVYQLYDPLTKLFQRKWYWLDTALVPEIIYHEYAHVALSDQLVLSHSSAINEGMADFFASQISESPELAKNIKKYNTFGGKDAENKQGYLLQFESTDYANTDFVFGILWEMKKIVGEDRGEAFMYELRNKLTTNSSIRVELIEGLLETCQEKCRTPFVDKLKILKALNTRGI